MYVNGRRQPLDLPLQCERRLLEIHLCVNNGHNTLDHGLRIDYDRQEHQPDRKPGHGAGRAS